MYADHEQNMNLSRREIHILLLHEFRLGHKATEAANNICSTMGGMYSLFVWHNIGSIGLRMVT